MQYNISMNAHTNNKNNTQGKNNMAKLTKPQQERFLNTWMGANGDNREYTSEYDKKVFTRLEKKADPLLKDVPFYMRGEVFERYLNGEFLRGDSLAFGLMLLTKYKKRQMRLSVILDEMGIPSAAYIHEEAACICRGLTAKYPELFSASFTHDLERVDILV